MVPAKKIMALSIILVTVIFTLGCAEEPPETEISSLIENQYKESLGAKVGMVEVLSVKKLKCVEAKDKAGFNCDVEITLKDAIKGEYKETKNMRFIEVDEVWRLAN
jgi:hypothetical protein